MDIQNYFNEITDRAKIFMDKSMNLKEKYPEFFESGSTDLLAGMTQDRMEIFFQASQIINDSQIIFTEIASLLYFCKKTGIELDTENINEIQGLSKFITIYEPFQTDYNITSEGILEVKNENKNKEKLISFGKNIKNIMSSKILKDES